MASSSHIRSTDRIKTVDLQSPNFKLRKNPPVAKITTMFMGISWIVLGVSAILFYDDLMGFYICLGSAVVVYFVSRQLARLQHILNSTEFLNALLSAIVNRNYKFTLVARNDGEIVYLNHSFQVMFPEFVVKENLNISAWCEAQKISADDQKLLMEKIVLCNADALKVAMQTSENNTSAPITLSLEPISGFEQHVLIHGA